MASRQVTFFTDTGSFGDASGLIRVDTTQWTDEDWTRIISADAVTRKVIAMQIEQQHKEKKEAQK